MSVSSSLRLVPLSGRVAAGVAAPIDAILSFLERHVQRPDLT